MEQERTERRPGQPAQEGRRDARGVQSRFRCDKVTKGVEPQSHWHCSSLSLERLSPHSLWLLAQLSPLIPSAHHHLAS